MSPSPLSVGRGVSSEAERGRLGPEETPASGSADAKMRILIVDDEEDVRLLVQLTLRTVGGMEALEAPDGLSAIAIAERERPDAILLDVMMPGLDGPETLARLRSSPSTSEIPVIFLSARTLRDDREPLLRLGAAGVLAKPFDARRLSDQIRELVSAPPRPAAPWQGEGERLSAAIAPLAAAFRMGLPGRLGQLRSSLDALAADPERGDLAAPLEKLAHRLAGIAGSHGLDRIGETARALELAVQTFSKSPAERETLLGEIRRRFDEVAAQIAGELAERGADGVSPKMSS
jgi:CheY-like chemotaxis protein